MYPPTTPSLTICTEQTFKCMLAKNQRASKTTSCHYSPLPELDTVPPLELEREASKCRGPCSEPHPSLAAQRNSEAIGPRGHAYLIVHVLSPASQPCSRHLRPWNSTGLRPNSRAYVGSSSIHPLEHEHATRMYIPSLKAKGQMFWGGVDKAWMYWSECMLIFCTVGGGGSGKGIPAWHPASICTLAWVQQALSGSMGVQGSRGEY